MTRTTTETLPGSDKNNNNANSSALKLALCSSATVKLEMEDKKAAADRKYTFGTLKHKCAF